MYYNHIGTWPDVSYGTTVNYWERSACTGAQWPCRLEANQQNKNTCVSGHSTEIKVVSNVQGTGYKIWGCMQRTRTNRDIVPLSTVPHTHAHTNLVASLDSTIVSDILPQSKISIDLKQKAHKVLITPHATV